MSAIKRLLSPMHSAQRDNSEAQLQRDFGEYPPAPLEAREPLGRFELIEVSLLGMFVSHLALLKDYFVLCCDNASSASRGSPHPPEQVGSETANAIRDFTEHYKSLPRTKRILTFLVFCPLAPLLFIFVVFLIGRSFWKRRDQKGFFCRMPQGMSRIYIKKSESSQRESIISHEHIHLLQYKNFGYVSKDINLPSDFLKEKYQQDAGVMYLMEKNEVEARLHEIVLSNFRVEGILPVDLSGFIKLLNRSEEVGDTVSDMLAASGLMPSEEPITSRDPVIAIEVDVILFVIRDPAMRAKFILEVLSTMYGNLLFCYGDKKTSEQFMSDIPRPNLYDVLYGNPPVKPQ